VGSGHRVIGSRQQVVSKRQCITSYQKLRIYLLDSSGRQELGDLFDGLISAMPGSRWRAVGSGQWTEGSAVVS
jgi:hypothetical protein